MLAGDDLASHRTNEFSLTGRSAKRVPRRRRATTAPTKRPSNSSSTTTAGDLGIGSGALRPTGVYGVTQPARDSKWFSRVGAVARGEDVTGTDQDRRDCSFLSSGS